MRSYSATTRFGARSRHESMINEATRHQPGFLYRGVIYQLGASLFGLRRRHGHVHVHTPADTGRRPPLDTPSPARRTRLPRGRRSSRVRPPAAAPPVRAPPVRPGTGAPRLRRRPAADPGDRRSRSVRREARSLPTHRAGARCLRPRPVRQPTHRRTTRSPALGHQGLGRRRRRRPRRQAAVTERCADRTTRERFRASIDRRPHPTDRYRRLGATHAQPLPVPR